MPNTTSAKKALRSSARKRKYNDYWKKRIKTSVRTLKDNLETKNVDVAILNKDLSVLQKVLDKASKKNVIHKNKAKRLKSKYAQRITALTKGKNAKAVNKKAQSNTGGSTAAGKSGKSGTKKS